ncbi:two-component regulator propeller domain-containing protein [Larkinella bovis]|uniref:Two-component regulator propeller domain-containing protein n=1 Tax=Larkinella bovis TaxID=683041 RepID=A0ABW0IK20_9BACT
MIFERRPALLLLLWWLSVQALAQAPTLSFQRLSLRQGLATNYTSSITQDDLGFIWIGTVSGLTRFDGLRCINYTPQFGNPHSLPHRTVRCVFKAQNGILWVGTQTGLARVDPQTQAFRRYSFKALGEGCNLIRTAAETPDGLLWFGTSGGVVQFNPQTGQSRLLTMPVDTSERPTANFIRKLLVDGSTLWIGTQAGLYAYQVATHQFRSYRRNATVPTSLPDDHVTALLRHPQSGVLYVGTRKGQVAIFDPVTGRFQPMPLNAGQSIASLLLAQNGILWVAVAGEGLYRYDAAKNRFLGYRNDENNPRSLVSNSLRTLFEDRSGIIWIGSDDAGVSWFNPKIDKFRSLYDDVGYRPTSTLGLDASSLSFDRQDRLWVASRDGLVMIDPQKQSYRVYRHDPKNPASVGNNLTYNALADRTGKIWVGHFTGLSRLDTTTHRFEQIPCLPALDNAANYPPFDPKRRDFVAGGQVFYCTQARDGRIFIGTNEKLTIYDPKTGEYLNRFNDERIRKLPGKNYNTLFIDKGNNLWVGGFGPVYKISPDLKLLKEYVHDENDPHSLPDDGVTDFSQDSNGRMWFSTDNGLARLDESTKRFEIYTTKHGLPNNDIAALRHTGDTLWISTSNGAAVTDVRKIRFIAFDEADGLPTTEFESGSSERDNKGRLYFGALRGLVYIQPGGVRINRFAPPVFLTSFKVNGREFLQGPTAHPPLIELEHNQNQFNFEMAALNFDNPAANRYAYRLEGFEDHWNQAGNRPFASYTSLPSGQYVLHIIAANNDGIWNRTGYRLRVTIQTPFWETWWFRIGAGAALIALGVAIAQWQARKAAREQQEKSDLRERIAMSEMKALRSQMNPHFLYNSLNAVRLFVLQNDSDNADKYLVKFARLMRLILGNSRQEWVTLASECEQLQLYLELEQLRFGHKFDFSIETDPSLDLERVSIPPMIIQPYIENAILHGMAHKKNRGRIQICIKPVNEHLECLVDDDGVGRQKAGEIKKKSATSHQSVGLKVTEERLQLIHQRSGKEAGVTIIDKVNDDNEPAGTRVVIRVPLTFQEPSETV